MVENIYFTSDTHFGHANIIKYCNRPYVNHWEHDEDLINRWNKVVKKNDHIYHLGDFGLAAPGYLIEIMKRLNGKIYFIRGNHDKNTFAALKKYNRFEWAKDYFNLKVMDPEVSEGYQRLFLIHYPMISWESSHRGSWNLHGHHHGVKMDNTRCVHLDVGVDKHDYYPISYEEVKTIITKQCMQIKKPVDERISVDMFGGKGSEQHNVLAQALMEAAGATGFDSENNEVIYNYLREIPKTSLVAELVAYMHSLGYEITPKTNNK